jgi:hypothetical protein
VSRKFCELFTLASSYRRALAVILVRFVAVERRNLATEIFFNGGNIMRHAIFFAALLALFVVRTATAEPLDELSKSFTVKGQPVPPDVFADFGDGDLADSRPIRVTIDVLAAVGSNLYFETVQRNGTWVSQKKDLQDDGPEEIAYSFEGTTQNRLLVVVTRYGGGGSGGFYNLHVLDAAPTYAFQNDGARYQRLNLTDIRSVALGDRWKGSVKIDGNRIAITTTGGALADVSGGAKTRIVDAERP